MTLTGSMLFKSVMPWAARLVSGSAAPARRQRERPCRILTPHPSDDDWSDGKGCRKAAC